MNKRWFRVCGLIITMTMGALIGWSVAIGNAVIPIPAAIGGAGLLYVLRKRLKEVVEDERNYRISEKASRSTVQISAFLMAITGAVLIALNISGASPFREVGLTLAFSGCALLIIYLTFYSYYSRKN